MRALLPLGLVLLLACSGPPAPAPHPEPAPPAPAQPTWRPVLVAGPLELELRDPLGRHVADGALVFRITNHGDHAVLVDLRSGARVVRPDEPPALRLPLSEAQRAELSTISALSQVGAGDAITYAVPYSASACTGARHVALGGVLVALDDERTIEAVADGAEVELSCAPAIDPPEGTRWVVSGSEMVAAGSSAETFADGLPDMLRAASVTPGVDVALLPYSYDALPMERWRYDACEALRRCPARVIAQPPGSIRAPAVGMSRAGVEAFCAARSLRALSTEEEAAVADPARALVASDTADVVTHGFRCARSEGEPPAAP